MASVDIRDSLDNTIIIMNSVMKGEVEVLRQFGDVAPIVCNPDELGQVWTNLITNAYHALKGRAGGRITISTEQISDSEVAIRISDNGPGIPEAIRSKIWDPFFTTKDQGEGTGLGLGIVRGIVDKHHARIEMDSRMGEGTTFSVIFNVSQPEELEHAPSRGNVHR
jgi:signal transduction histidine kinase